MRLHRLKLYRPSRSEAGVGAGGQAKLYTPLRVVKGSGPILTGSSVFSLIWVNGNPVKLTQFVVLTTFFFKTGVISPKF